MRVVAYMPVFNEADVLPFVLAHMRAQGIEVHALDGWSTDGSYELLSAAGAGVTVERFPAEGSASAQVCRDILGRVEELAEKSDADWCGLSDADEWRRSSRAGERLVDAIARVDRDGYNVIDHRVFAFFCTDAGWQGDPEQYFRFYNTTDPICKLPQEKFWKNAGRVNLCDGAGHAVVFSGKRVAPEKFVMKHYPYRTPDQARRKIETRLARRCETEHREGWGVHYDEFQIGQDSFCWNPAALYEWPGDLKAPLPMRDRTERPRFSILHTSARPGAWRAVYDAWLKAAVHPEDVEYVLVVDPRWGFNVRPDVDASAGWVRAQDKLICNTGRMCYVDGVNLAAKNATGDILIVVADDQFPAEQWDAALTSALPSLNPGAEFVLRLSTGTPHERERGITVMPILSRARYNRLGYVFYPAYESMYADNDLTAHAEHDGVLIDGPVDLVFPHRHAYWDKTVVFDEAYQRQNRPEAYELGSRLFAERKANGFGSKLAVVPSPPVPNTGKNLAICLPGEWFHSTWVAENALQLCCHLFNRFRNVWPVMPVVTDVYKMRHLTFEYIKALPQPADLVLWIDDDNLLLASQFEMLLNDLDTHPELSGVVGWCWIHPDARMSCGAFAENGASVSFDYDKVMAADSDLIPVDWSGFPIVLHRGNVIEKIGAFPFRPLLNDAWSTGMSGEDTSFFQRAADAGLKFVCDRRVKVPHLKYGNPEPDWMMKGPRKTTAMGEVPVTVSETPGAAAAQKFLGMVRAIAGR